jgi:cell division protein FtsW (lipid II flippase)
MKSLAKDFIPPGVVLFFVGLVLAEPDLGMAISIIMITGLLLLSAASG